MKVATFIESGKMTVTEAPVPEIQKDTDAIIKIVRACVCGSDLWWFRGISKREPNSYTGHEAIGIVETVGNALLAVLVLMAIVPIWNQVVMLAIKVNISALQMLIGHLLKFLDNRLTIQMTY